MLQCPEKAPSSVHKPAFDFVWSVYLRVAGTATLDAAAVAGNKMAILRGPERMFYGLVECEVCDPDGYRVCVSGDAPAGANVKNHVE